ncbi:MAG: aminomethyl-transferring glycine dehydrogenase subunit GcvPA [Candidatus Marinimicrobia bacterium]|nr:aminomethyl-transferring glycine dehydrogenase subunit GcvPA [Candidatus Neomarinimicrobiota bacterium]
MPKPEKFIHPYIPNSLPKIQQAMLAEIGADSIDELYADIPNDLRFQQSLDIPEPILSEAALKRHVQQILNKNITCEEYLSFLGGGCWQHYVPAICDEINGRSEFLTAYAGEPYEDQGRFQSLFEYQSLMAELLDVDVVNVPNFDWSQAAATSLRMAGRITSRKTALVSKWTGPDRLNMIKNYLQPVMAVQCLPHDPQTGLVDLDRLADLLSPEVAGVYIEVPEFLGPLETNGDVIADMVHKAGALFVVGVDPSSLGVIKPPSQYGADITCGDIQPLGMHLNYGGALGGFIGTCDDEIFVSEYPSRLFGITKTSEEGEYGFGDVLYDRTSFGDRQNSKEYVGTASALWGITAAVYLSLMGPQGMHELGQNILQTSLYTQQKIGQLPGVKAPRFSASHFKEFVVDFSESGKSVAAINAALLERGIFGGKDLSIDFAELGQSALFCITEIHTKADIDALVNHLTEILNE